MTISIEQQNDFIEYCKDFIRDSNKNLAYRNLSSNIAHFLDKSPSLGNAPNGVFGRFFSSGASNGSSISIKKRKTFFLNLLDKEKYIIDDFLLKFRDYKDSFVRSWPIQHAFINLFPYSQIIGNCEEKSILLAKKISDKTHNFFPLNAHFYLGYGNNFDHMFILAQLASQDTPSLEDPHVCINKLLQKKDYFLIIDPWLNNVFPLEKTPYYWKSMLENDNNIRNIRKIFNLVKNSESYSPAFHNLIFNYLDLNICKKIDFTYSKKITNAMNYLQTDKKEIINFKNYFLFEIRDMEQFHTEFLAKMEESEELFNLH